MKKISLSALLLAFSLIVYAQNEDSVKKSGVSGNNEIRLNLFNSILGIPEINYERIVADDMGVGLGVFIPVDKTTDYNFGIIPHFRVYFGGKKAAGFFVEGNAALVSLKDYSHLSYSSVNNTYYTTYGKTNGTHFGLGAAAGGKFLTKNGFIGEIYAGLGRLFGDADIEAYPRAGITIGKRF